MILINLRLQNSHQKKRNSTKKNPKTPPITAQHILQLK